MYTGFETELAYPEAVEGMFFIHLWAGDWENGPDVVEYVDIYINF